MKETRLILTIATVMMMSFGMTGCKQSQPAEQPAETDTMQQVEEAVEEAKPVVSWQTTIDDYLTNVIGPRFELKNVIIVPSYTVIAVDSSNDNDFRVWGDWQVFAYDTHGETLITSIATWVPGLFHLRKTADGFEVKELEVVEEGRAIEENAQRIFGKYCDAFWAANQNQEHNDSVRLAIMSEYVRKNNLPYTKLELDSAELPVPLKL